MDVVRLHISLMHTEIESAYVKVMKYNTDESTLLLGLKSGDEKAFVAIYKMYWKSLFNHAYYRLPDEQHVKELVQDVFSDLWQHREQLDIHTSLLGYLQSALKFKILNFYKREGIKERVVSYIDRERSDSLDQVNQEIQYTELSRAFQEAIRLLPIQRQRAYILKFNQGLTYVEIAKCLEISVRTVEKHISLATKTIRLKLRDFR